MSLEVFNEYLNESYHDAKNYVLSLRGDQAYNLLSQAAESDIEDMEYRENLTQILKELSGTYPLPLIHLMVNNDDPGLLETILVTQDKRYIAELACENSCADVFSEIVNYLARDDLYAIIEGGRIQNDRIIEKIDEMLG